MYQQYIPDSNLKTLQQAVQVLKQLYERQIIGISNERNYKLLETEKENATWVERDERNQRMREALLSTEPRMAELHKMVDLISTFETLVSASVKYYNTDAGETCPVCTKVFEKKEETTEQF